MTEEFYYSSDMAIRRRRMEAALKGLAIIGLVALALLAAGIEESSAIQVSNETSATTTMAQMGITQ